ncbi:MAG: uroporphyrinogen decarboxylase family protein [Dehalococcoidia bacterium]
MNKKERVRAALAGHDVDHAPVSLWGHDFLREWTPRGLVAATLDAYRAHDWDFIKFNPRATYFAEAWGNTYERPTGQHQPRLTGVAVGNAQALHGIRPENPHRGVFGEHLHALRLLLDEVGDEVDVVHTVFSPLGVVAMLCGTQNEFLDYAHQNLTGAHHALQAVTETLAGYAEAALDAGASGIFFAPLTWASRNTCDEAFYREFGRPYDLQVLWSIQPAPFNILHVCRSHNLIDLLLDYPVAVFNWADRQEGNPSLADVRERSGKPVMGGVDQVAIATADAATVGAQAADAVRSVPRGLFVTGGCAIPPATPTANIRAVIDTVRSAA